MDGGTGRWGDGWTGGDWTVVTKDWYDGMMNGRENEFLGNGTDGFFS